MGVTTVPLFELEVPSETSVAALGPSAWYRTDALTGFNNGDAVTTFTDSSGNGYDAVQGTASKRPTYVTSAMNGRPALLFDGVNDGYDGTTALSSLFGANGVRTIFVAAGLTTSAAGTYVFLTDDNSVFSLHYLTNVMDGPRLIHTNHDGALDTVIKFQVLAGSGEQILASAMFSGSAVTVGYNDTDTAALATAASGALSDLTGTLNIGQTAGGGSTWTGYIAEILIFNSALSEANRQIVERYLYEKYSIPDATTGGLDWEDATSDVLIDPSPEWETGIRSSEPLDLTATPGTLRLYFNNAASNSGGVVGYYSPDHPSKRLGFDLNTRIRVKLDGAIQFLGWISSITPTPGAFGQRDVEVVALDYMSKLMEEPITGLATMTNTTADLVLDAIIAAMTTQPESSSTTAASDTLPYALDTSRQDEGNALSEVAKVVQSDGGVAWVSRPGTFTFRPRSSRTSVSSGLTLTEDDLDAIEIQYPADAVRNRIRVKVYPRAVDGSSVVLFTQPTTVTPALTAGGEAIVIQCPFSDPNNRSSRIGGTALVDPVATTDYLANSLADGSGTNLTGSLTVTPDHGCDATQLTISLGGGTSGYLTKLQVRGKGLYPYAAQTVEARDATSIAKYGMRSLLIEMPYQGDINVGQAVADAYLERWKDPGPSALSVSFWAITTTLLSHALGSGSISSINSCISISESVTTGGLEGAYFINGFRGRLVHGRYFYATWYLARADTTPAFILDEDTLDDAGLGAG